jgi:serine/threonine protein kinase
MNRMLLCTMLQQAGYDVRAASDGREALALIEANPPEVVLLDVQMPVMDGHAVCREMQLRPRLASVPVVFISALDDTSEKLKGFEAGGVDYVTKPFEPAEVLARVGTQVKLFRAQRELTKRNAELQRKNEQLQQAQQRTERIFLALSEALPGTVLDDTYRLDEKIGEGGFGAVFRGTHLRLRRSVAVKVLRPSGLHDGAEQVARFRREGIAACRVVHPNAIEVMDFGVASNGMAYLVMELLTGRSLGALLLETRTLPVARLASVVVPMCGALDAAHAAGIVHRDVKPDNVFLHVSESGEVVKVLDFGIARLLDDSEPAGASPVTQVGSLIGTPTYMAPERLLGMAYDARSDVYSVGVLMYFALSGELPFVVDSPSNVGEIMKLHLTSKPRPLGGLAPDVPAPVAELVMNALEYDAAQRPALRDIARGLRAIAK